MRDGEPPGNAASPDGGPARPDGFDDDLYLELNPDLRLAFDAGLIASAFDHWRETGAGETRDGVRPTLLDQPFADRSPLPTTADATGLDVATYLALNPDLAGPLGDDASAARDHWLAHGAVEGRIGFGAPPPWDRAFGRPTGRDAPSAGCELFVEADPFGGDEAALGRRLLGALRAVGFPVSVRAYTSRDGRLVLADRDDAAGPARPAVLVVATPALCRQILAAIGPDRLAGRTVLALLARAPLRRYMPDWPLLASLDAVLVPAGGDAALLRAVSPVPVHEVAVVPATLSGRAAARRLLGLADSDRVVLREIPEGEGARCSVARWTERSFDRSFDDVPDPWTGASRLLAAADRFVAAPGGGSAIRRADAEQARLVGPSTPLPPPPTRADVGAQIVRMIGVARGGPRGPARLPLPRLPERAATGAEPPVLSLLAEAGAIDAVVLVRLGEADWGFFELCVALPAGMPAAPFLADAARRDPRIRPVAAADASGPGPGRAAAVATGTHLLPIFDQAGALRIASGLAVVAGRLAATNAPDLLVEALDGRELRFPAASPLALPIRDRLEHAPAAPLAVSRPAFGRVNGATLLGSGRGAAPALTLALLRDGVSIGAVALPPPDRAEAPDPDEIATERALRRHVVGAAGEAAAVERGFLPATFRIRRHDVGAPRFTVLRLDAGADAPDLAAVGTEHVLLVGQPIAPPSQALFGAAAELLADPGIGAVCPVTLDADGLIAEAGLFATVDGEFEAGPESGWPFDACGPGRDALRVRNVHATACALATRRSLLREVGPSWRSVETVASALGRAGWRIVATPWATVRLLRP